MTAQFKAHEVHEFAGKRLPKALLTDIPKLLSAYHHDKPDPSVVSERVAFGTSGHRGSSLERSFNEDHILAMSQAVCDYRNSRNIEGPLFLGKDTHALSEPAFENALEVLAANHVRVIVQEGLGSTPTPVISHAIITHNGKKTEGLADGIIITPSHNPPSDGGFKYNPPHGGPAGLEVTQFIEARANQILFEWLRNVKRIPYEKILRSREILKQDFVSAYVVDLENVLDMKAIAGAKIKIGVDPLGGAAGDYWPAIAAHYGLSLDVINHAANPDFSFLPADKDGKIRMDCSSPYAMAELIGRKDDFDIALGNDCDADRHGIVTPAGGLLNPNHYLTLASGYLFQNRPGWDRNAVIGKSFVTTAMMDRVAASLGRKVFETPVGFKWFVSKLYDGSCGLAGEESGGASFLRKNGRVWTTDKDGILLGLLACEILAKTGKDPTLIYKELTSKFGASCYGRMDIATPNLRKNLLQQFLSTVARSKQIAGEKVTAQYTHAAGNQEPIGGIKMTTENGWFSVRPSGTEALYKIYAESFKGEEHLNQILNEVRDLMDGVFLTRRGAGGHNEEQ